MDCWMDFADIDIGASQEDCRFLANPATGSPAHRCTPEPCQTELTEAVLLPVLSDL